MNAYPLKNRCLRILKGMLRKLDRVAYVFLNGLLFCFWLVTISCHAQPNASREKIEISQKDSILFERYVQQMDLQKELAPGDLMVETARFFLGMPYVGGTLEKEPERLVVNLSELDCLTLVENVMALSWTIKQGGGLEHFQKHLKSIRYRNPEQSELTYVDRLHYTSDWIYENERKGYVIDLTKEIGGKPFPLHLSFMSTHPKSYKQLSKNPEMVDIMAKKEMEINARSYYYIPQEEIQQFAKQIRQGDIVCFVTTIKGLDISHLGIACWKGDTLTFIHASSDKKQVIINEAPLQEYVLSIKRHCGIMVIRPNL